MRLAGIDAAEWEALANWARQAGLPALAGLLGSDLPVGLDRSQLLRLVSECAGADWDTLDGPALGGFAPFSLFVDTAAQQEGAGAWFVVEGSLREEMDEHRREGH